MLGTANRARSHRATGLVAFCVLLASSLLWLPAGGLPTPNPSVGIEPGASDARTPSLAVDAAGLLHVVRSDDVSGERGIYYTPSPDGVTWGPSVRVDTPGQSAYYPRIAMEREPVPLRGRVYVAYQTVAAGDADVWFVTSDGGIWVTPQRLDSAPAGASSNFPAIAASGMRVYAVWSDGRDGLVYHAYARASLDGGGTWGPEVQISTAGGSNLQGRIDAKGDIVTIVWRQSFVSGPAIAAARSEDAGATWRQTLVATAPTATDNLLTPDVLVDELGMAHVVWSQTDSTSASHIMYARSADGLAWTMPVRVDDSIAGIPAAQSPSITALAGTLWIAWQDHRNGDSDILASWSTDGVRWGDGMVNGNDLRVDDTDRNGPPADDATEQANPVVRTGGYGVYLAWEDYRSTTSWDVYFSEVQVSPLVITEVQDEPQSESRVEVYNLGPAFPLTGVTLVAGRTTVDLTPLGSLPARSHVVVGAPPNSNLQVALDMGSEGALVEVRQGAAVLASAGTGMFGIGTDPVPWESTSRYAGTLDYAEAWTRTPTTSFGIRNVAVAPNLAPPVVLNEVLFNPSRPWERFIELYLRGAGPLDLAGYQLVSDGVDSFPSTTISIGTPYAFLFEGRSPAWFWPLNASGDNVYLYDSGGRLLDMIGWTDPHAPGMTVARATLGAGGLRGYDDASATSNGWVFDRTPSLPLVDLASDARQMADVGTSVTFPLAATNLQTTSEYLNLAYSTVTSWPVALTWTNGMPLTDSIGDLDLLPDLGSVGPGATIAFLAEVTVPVEGQIGHGNLVNVTAIAASLPIARDWVTLAVDLFPHFDVTRTVSPSPVYLEGSGPPYAEVSEITVSVMGAGLPMVQLIPIDVVWQIDVSGSMSSSDPLNLRVDAVNYFIDNMRVDDRGSVVAFNEDAWVVNGRPLTYTDAMGKQTLKGDANTTRFANGGTNIDDAILEANNLLMAQGNRTRPRIEILLTDGVCTSPPFNPCPDTDNLVNQAAAAGIVIYTIGLGGAVDQAFLDSIATRTGGRYYHANTAQDLMPIYQEIGLRINRTAGIDPNPQDTVPMIEDHIAPYLHIVLGSFRDPVTGLQRDPSSMQLLVDRTRIQWNVSRIDINETWSVRFNVTSTRPGVQDVALHPDARISYVRWDSSSVSQPIPQGTLEVLRPPSPPVITATVPNQGAIDVPLDQLIDATFSQDMDTPTVLWTISPPVSATPTWSGRTLRLDHAGLAECTLYVVHVTRGFDLDGEALVPGPAPNPWSFHTVCPLRVRYTITREPLYGTVTVDDTAYPAPATFVWLANETHTVEVPDPDPFGGSRLVFDSWSDGGSRAHSVFVGMTDATITATFSLQHPADLIFLGLTPRNPVNITFRRGAPAQASHHAAWSGWVDDGSKLTVDDLIPGVLGERFLTRDEWQWTVNAPLSKTVRYDHQYIAKVRLVGLLGNRVGLDFHSLGGTEHADVGDIWSDWVDAGRPLRVEPVLTLGQRERFRTFDPTDWIVDAPIDATVRYLRQFRPYIRLVGLGGNHAVGATWWEDGQPAQARGLDAELFRWADAGSVLRFDERTGGTPPKFALDPTTFEVTTAFDATIRYDLAPPPPAENWKPILALVYTTGLLVAGGTGSRRLIDHYVPKPANGTRVGRRTSWKGLPVGRKLAQLTIREVDLKVHRDRRLTRVVLLLPFAGAEGAIGLLSHLTGILRIPEAGQWFPLGFWLNTALLAAGVVASLAVWRRGYRMTDEALLKLAEVRAKAEVARLRALSRSVAEQATAMRAEAEGRDPGQANPKAREE